jgi:broad specificity phosphatase PhoE
MKSFYVQRHGLRLDIHDRNEWLSSQRCKENYNDPPLFDENEKDIFNNIECITDPIEVIYTSPATRCIQTALIIQKGLTTNPKIIVEYGLMETQVMEVTKLNENFIQGEMGKIPQIIYGNSYYKYIDYKLSPRGIKKRYPTVDSYNSIYEPDVPFFMSQKDWANRIFNIINIFKERHSHVLLVGHAGTIVSIIPHLANRSLMGVIAKISGDSQTGVLVKYKSVNNVKTISVFKNGEITYKLEENLKPVILAPTRLYCRHNSISCCDYGYVCRHKGKLIKANNYYKGVCSVLCSNCKTVNFYNYDIDISFVYSNRYKLYFMVIKSKSEYFENTKRYVQLRYYPKENIFANGKIFLGCINFENKNNGFPKRRSLEYSGGYSPELLKYVHSQIYYKIHSNKYTLVVNKNLMYIRKALYRMQVPREIIKIIILNIIF